MLVVAATAALIARGALPPKRRGGVVSTAGCGVVGGALGGLVLGAIFDSGPGVEDAVLFYAALGGASAAGLAGSRRPQVRSR